MGMLQQCRVLNIKDKPEAKTMVVASRQVDCYGVGKQKCFLYKEEGEKAWQYLYQDIQGLKYEPGYEYILKVRQESIANPPADAPSIRYVLERIVSKEKENSLID